MVYSGNNSYSYADITSFFVRDYFILDATLVVRFKAYIRKDSGIIYRIWHVYVKG
jgi:hypothetical protein